jgi:GT2 family glycosyltransferase
MAINFSMTKKVAVVILGWNGKKFLEQFLPSVVQHTPQDWCEIVVADNASTDGSIEFVQENYPQITIIQNGRNGGYAGGYNDALAKIKTDYYVLLNQDIEVTEGWIARIVDVMDGDRKIAAAQPKLLDYFKRNKFEYAGASGGFIDAFGYAFCRGRVFDTIEEDNGQYDDVVPVFWATGACLVVRADAYWQAGGLDEDFFAHQEEIDLCWRMQNLGYKTFSPYIDESYDTEVDNYKRLNMIVQEVNRICNLSKEDYDTLISNCKEIAEYNFTILTVHKKSYDH